MTNDEMKAKTRDEVIMGLRTLADILEANPDAPTPYFGTGYVGVSSIDEMRSAAKSYGGFWKKEPDQNDYQMRKEITPSLSILIYASHEKVCKKIVVGKKLIPAVTLPARAEIVMPEHEEEIVEWHCPEVLSGKVAEP